MKLFSEYFAGHISHDHFLFGEDDMKFLEQFPTEVWNKAIKMRYYVDLPKALSQREEARRNKSLPNLTDLSGNPTNAKYYELIEKEAQTIQGQLTQIHNPENARTRHRIAQTAYNSAKNRVDSMLSERSDRGGEWMVYTELDARGRATRKSYNFMVQSGRKRNEIPVKRIRSYIPELIKRIEGPKGSSSIGYDLSNIQDFDPSIPDDKQNGGWKTLGFSCPQNDVISDNLQSWIGYSSQGLLDPPGSIVDHEAHRSQEKEEYKGNAQAREEVIDKTIYKNPLRNYYSNYINRLKSLLRKDDDISDEDLETLYDRFSRTYENIYGDEAYAYRSVRNNFINHLEAAMGNTDAHEFDHEAFVEMIQACIGVNVPFQQALINALADIDLITHKIPNYHGANIDHERSSDFKILTRERPHGKVPDLKNGKILFHIETVKRKLKDKLDVLNARMESLATNARDLRDENALSRNQAARERIQNEINDIDELLNRDNPDNIIDRHGVGHHFNVGDILDNPDISPEEIKRQKIFLQFNNEREVPSVLDKRDRVLGGGIYPHKNMPQSKGPGGKNVSNALQNLRRFLEDPAAIRDVITNFVSKNYDGNLNILFKVFVDSNGNPTDANTYKIFVDLIKDQCLRNIGVFDMTEPRPILISRQIKKIILNTCNRLVEKEVGEAGPIRQRQGEEANAADVRREIRAMFAKTA